MTSDVPRVLILTPVKDAVDHLSRYVECLADLDYPRERLSLGMLEGDSADETFAEMQRLHPLLEGRFARVSLHKRDTGFKFPPGLPRWTAALQLARRSVLARARNQLLFRALRDEHWVLWLDVDVISYPSDILKRMIALDLDIVHPHCVLEAGGPTFDQNAWAHHGRRMDTMRGDGRPVRLDAVGGTMLLVRADLHRDGLIFPPFRFGVESAVARPSHPVWGKGEIETEGLGIMAREMGSQCWGLPDVEIIHKQG